MSQTTMEPAAALQQLRQIVDGAVTGHIFGTPIEQDDMIVLPVAKVSGGGGGGGGTAPGVGGTGGSRPERSSPETGGAGMANGGGGGLGLSAKPLGVFVIRRGKVRWRPAVDVNKVIMGAQVVAVAALLTLRTIIRAHAASARH